MESLTQSVNESISQSLNLLPFSGLHHLPDLALHQVAFQRADTADIELAVQMIGFVLEGARQKFFARLLKRFSMHILGTDGDLEGALHVLAKIGDAQAPFALWGVALGVIVFGIDNA